MAQKVGETIEKEVCCLYKQNKTCQEISQLVGVGLSTVRRILKRNNIDIHCRKREMNKERYDLVEKLWLEGWSITKIRKEVHMTNQKISKYLKGLGYNIIQDGRKHFFNFDYFETIDTSDKAYWLGFIYADGWVIKDKELGIALKADDVEHLCKFLNNINNKDIKPKMYSVGEHKACRITISSRKMLQDLERLGVYQNKSLTISFPMQEQLPDKFLFDFIRGYVDGDGSLRIKDGKYANLSVCCGSRQFLEGMLQRTRWSGTIRKSRELYYLEWSCQKAFTKIHCLYKDSSVYLDRKYKVYQNLIAVLGGNI